MLRSIRALITLLIAVASVVVVRAETGVLVLKVHDSNRRPLRGIRVDVDVPLASPLGRSDDQGILRIKLPAGINPRTWVRLRLPKDGYTFLDPWDEHVQVPAFELEAVNYVPVFLISKRSRDALLSGDVIREFVDEINKTNRRPTAAGSAEGDPKAAVAAIARRHGLQPADVEQAIKDFRSKADDPYDKGIADLEGGNYSAAIDNLSRALAPAQTNFQRVTFSLGQAFYNTDRYDEAAAKFRIAAELREEDPIVLDYLGLSLLHAGRFTEAEPPLTQVLRIRETALGKLHRARFSGPLLDYHLRFYAERCRKWEPFIREGYLIDLQGTRSNLPPFCVPYFVGISDLSRSLENLASLFEKQGNDSKAEHVHERIVYMYITALGARNATTARRRITLARLYDSHGKYVEAERLYRDVLGLKMPSRRELATVTFLDDYADLLRRMKRDTEASAIEALARRQRESK